MAVDVDSSPLQGLGDIRTERSRIREILVLVPAIALIINVASTYLAGANWKWQAGSLFAALLVSILVIRKSPLFSLAGRFSAHMTIAYDANKQRIVSNLGPLDMMQDPLVSESFAFTIQSIHQDLQKAGAAIGPDEANPVADALRDALVDAAFYWCIQTLERDFQGSWKKRRMIPFGAGYSIQQGAANGKQTRILDSPGSRTFLDEHPAFASPPLNLNDTAIFLPKGAKLDRLEAPNPNSRAITFKNCGTKVVVQVGIGGWSTGVPPDTMEQIVRRLQADGNMEAIMEEQRYWAKVARIAAVATVEYKVKPLAVFGPGFESKVEWIEALVDSISRRARRDANYMGVEKS